MSYIKYERFDTIYRSVKRALFNTIYDCIRSQRVCSGSKTGRWSASGKLDAATAAFRAVVNPDRLNAPLVEPDVLAERRAKVARLEAESRCSESNLTTTRAVNEDMVREVKNLRGQVSNCEKGQAGWRENCGKGQAGWRESTHADAVSLYSEFAKLKKENIDLGVNLGHSKREAKRLSEKLVKAMDDLDCHDRQRVSLVAECRRLGCDLASARRENLTLTGHVNLLRAACHKALQFSCENFSDFVTSALSNTMGVADGATKPKYTVT